MNSGIESVFVKSFVYPDKQERALILLNSKKKRHEFHGKLDSFLDPQHFHEIKLGLITEAFDVLCENGAPEDCYVFSRDEALDGKRISLKEAFMDEVYCRLSLIVCVPDGLAYYHDENGRKYVLRR